METKFNFKSQICTTEQQSKYLLELGLKKETADMYMTPSWGGIPSKIIGYYCPNVVCFDDHFDAEPNDLPAWSLGRLMEMLPSPVPISVDLSTFHNYAYLDLSKVSAHYYWKDYDGDERALVSFCGNGLFAAVVDAIEWLIKEGYFNKEYLEE